MTITGMLLRTYYSLQHIQSAAYMALTSERLEESLDSKESHEISILRAYSVSALFSSVAFLEALANEIYADSFSKSAWLNPLYVCDDFDELFLVNTSSISKTQFRELKTITQKFNYYLEFSGLNKINDVLTEDVVKLIKLRNTLIHYKAGYLDVGTKEMLSQKALSRSDVFKGLSEKFAYRKEANPTDACKWIGAGLAQWSVETVLAYSDEFFKIIRITPIYKDPQYRIKYKKSQNHRRYPAKY